MNELVNTREDFMNNVVTRNSHCIIQKQQITSQAREAFLNNVEINNVNGEKR